MSVRPWVVPSHPDPVQITSRNQDAHVYNSVPDSHHSSAPVESTDAELVVETVLIPQTFPNFPLRLPGQTLYS